MYVKESFSITRLLRGIWREVLLITMYAALVFYLYQYHQWQFLAFPISIISILGTSLSLLLGFRTNSAYDRWWEARHIWGAITNDSRTLVRQTLSFIEASPTEQKNIAQNVAHLQIAWCYALNYTLRRLPVLSQASFHMTADEMEFVKKHDNIPNGILLLMQNHITEAFHQGQIDHILFQSIDDTFRRLCDAMGKAERIKNTTFPTQYSFFVHFTILIFTIILPMGLIESIGRIAIPITFVISFLFLYIESIAYVMQNPFENNPNDIPMTSICRNIEINLLEMVGETNIPEKLQPKDGYIM